MFVPADNNAIVTVYATLNSITSSSGATSGEFPDFSLAFETFQAEAGSSGELYRGDKIDADVAAASDLDFGAITYVDPETTVLDGAVASVTAGSNITFAIDDGNDAITTTFLPIGAIVCFDLGVTHTSADSTINGTCDNTADTGDSVVAITSRSGGTTEDTYTGFVMQDEDAALADNLAVYYALPGTGYLSGSNQMHVTETKPTLTLASSSPTSGSRSVDANDEAFAFTVSADSGEDVVVRYGVNGDDETDVEAANMTATGTPNDADVALTSAAGEVVDGTSALEVTATAGQGFIADGDCFVSPTALTAGTSQGQLGFHEYVSFWINSSETDVTYDSLGFVLTADTTCASPVEAVLGDATITDDVYVNGTALSTAGSAVTTVIGGGTADRWELVTVDIGAGGINFSNLATATHWGFSVDNGTTDFADTDQFRVDGVVFHNEVIVVDISASDSDFNTDETSGLAVNLKESGNTLATGSIGYLSTSEAKVMFVPTSTNIEVAKGDSKTFTLEVNSDTMLDQDPSIADPVTFSMDMGSASGGVVTPGDFWWYDDNATYRWVGRVDQSTLSGNTVDY